MNNHTDDMPGEIDFSKGERGKFYNPNAKHNIPVYLDSEVLDYFVEKAKIKALLSHSLIVIRPASSGAGLFDSVAGLD